MGTAGPPLTGLADVTVVGGDAAPVLDGVTLLAGPGEILAVIGPSGSGKSTALRAVAGLVEVQRGEVWVAGRRVTDLPAHQRGLAMSFETAALLPFLDVAGNLTAGMRTRHRSPGEIAARLTAETRLLRLGGLLRRRPAGLSAGERGLVGVGRATIDVPDAYLFDEPLAHLDAAGRSHARHAIAARVREAGVPALYVTHDQAEAFTVADRIAVLRAGRVAQTGTGRELWERPADLFVALFVGSPPMGLLRGRLVETGGVAGFVVGHRTLPLWSPVPEALHDRLGRDVVLGLRPESVGPVGGAQTVGLDGVAVTVERTGPATHVTVEIDAPAVTAPGADPPAGRARLAAGYPPHDPVRVGDRVRVAVDATRVHVFDPVTGRALWHPPSDRPPAGPAARPGSAG
jgi:multiple sugar transport system ATP-binding protein